MFKRVFRVALMSILVLSTGVVVAPAASAADVNQYVAINGAKAPPACKAEKQTRTSLGLAPGLSLTSKGVSAKLIVSATEERWYSPTTSLVNGRVYINFDYTVRVIGSNLSFPNFIEGGKVMCRA